MLNKCLHLTKPSLKGLTKITDAYDINLSTYTYYIKFLQ